MTDAGDALATWLPVGSIYLELAAEPPVRPARPYCQGDVFVDVPIPTARRAAEEPAIVRGPAILLGHPCNIHAGPNVNAVQLVAAVRPTREAQGQHEFEPPWDSHFALFPLPGLLDGEDFVADLRRIGTTHYKNLDDKRIACLTLEGWSALQRRLAYHTLRADIPLATRIEDLRAGWNELLLWEEWNTRGNDRKGFPAWLRAPQESGAFADTPRSQLLDYGLAELLSEIPDPNAR